MDEPTSASERDGAVGVITIDRRERFNSLDVDDRAGPAQGRAAARARRRGARRGAARRRAASSAAAPISSTSAPAATRATSATCSPRRARRAGGYGEVFKQILEYIHSTISEIRRAPKPFIAAVDGIAAAGGFGIAMACDLVLASRARDASSGPTARPGLTGAESSTFFLPRLVGLRRAMELVLLNPRLDADAALALGLVTAVVPDRALRRRGARAGATRLADGPTAAYAIAKGLINRAAGVRPARLPPRPRARAAGAHRRRRRLRRGPRRLLRQAPGALSGVRVDACTSTRSSQRPARARRSRGRARGATRRPPVRVRHRRARRRRARAAAPAFDAVPRAHDLRRRPSSRSRRCRLRWACPRCGEPIARGALLRCRDCGARRGWSRGDEIVLERIEMEVP